MAQVQTVRGPIDSAALGRVLIHEHVFTMDMEFTWNYRPDFFADETITQAADRLNALKASGIDTIVELTVLGLGRHIPSIEKVARLTDLNIIVSTGVYTFDAVPGPYLMHGPGLRVDRPEPMIEHFVRDITQGIAGTDIKAGELKCAIDMAGLRPGVERVLRAVAQANLQTGTPITVHTAPQIEAGLIVQQVLREEGVDLEDVVIGHCGDSKDLDYLMKLADEGSLLGMDRFGLNMGITPADRVSTIAELVKRGYVNHLALSHDCSAWTDFYPSMDDYHAALPNHHYLHIHDDVIPALLEAGVSQDDLDTMFIANPRRHFEKAARHFAQRG